MIFLNENGIPSASGAAACVLLAECLAPAREALGKELVTSISEAWTSGGLLNEAKQDELLSRVERWMAEASRIAIGYKKARDASALWTLIIVGFGLFLSIMMSTAAATLTGSALVYIGIAVSVIGMIHGLMNLIESLQDFAAKRQEFKVEGAAIRAQLDAVKPKIKDPELSAKISAISAKLGGMF